MTVEYARRSRRLIEFWIGRWNAARRAQEAATPSQPPEPSNEPDTLRIPAGISEAQAEAIRAEWRQKYAGPENVYRLYSNLRVIK